MTDDEKIKAVTATLAGQFYIGQRVRTRLGSHGTVVAIEPDGSVTWFNVAFADGTCPPYLASELEAL